MARVKFEKNSTVWKMFMDFWELCQNYWDPEDTDEWWQELSEEIDKFSKKYGGAVFPRILGLALSDKLEEEAKQRWGKSTSTQS